MNHTSIFRTIHCSHPLFSDKWLEQFQFRLTIPWLTMTWMKEYKNCLSIFDWHIKIVPVNICWDHWFFCYLLWARSHRIVKCQKSLSAKRARPIIHTKTNNYSTFVRTQRVGSRPWSNIFNGSGNVSLMSMCDSNSMMLHKYSHSFRSFWT